MVWLAILRLALGPPGEVPFRNATIMYAPTGRNLMTGRFGHILAVNIDAAIAMNVEIHPAVERGLRPQPTRRGPNHAFFPIRGEVRMTRAYHLADFRSRPFCPLVRWMLPVTQDPGQDP